MRKSRFTEEQIIGILQEYAACTKTGELIRRDGVSHETSFTGGGKYGGASMVKRPVGVTKLRQLVWDRVDKVSIRPVVGNRDERPAAYTCFFNGSRPHRSTIRKVGAWVLGKGDSGLSIDPHDIETALIALKSLPSNGTSCSRRRE